MRKVPITIIEFDSEKNVKDFFRIFEKNPEFIAIIVRYAKAMLSGDSNRANTYLESDLWRFLSDATIDFNDADLDEVFAGLLSFIKVGALDHVQDLIREGVTLNAAGEKVTALKNEILVVKLCASIKRRLTQQFGPKIDPRYRNVRS